MHDLRWLRENPAAFDHGMARRGLSPASADILTLDKEKRAVETRVQEEQALRNRLSKEIGQKRGPDGKPPKEMLDKVAALKESLRAGELQLKRLDEELQESLAGLPNLLADDVPDGPDESANREERRWGEPRSLDFEPKAHDDIGPALGMDLDRAAGLSGARFAVLKGGLAQIGAGHCPIHAGCADGKSMAIWKSRRRLLVRDRSLIRHQSVAQICRVISSSTIDGRWLIPTAEVPLTNLVAGEILDAEALPYRFTAWTPCFRLEAGAAGKDTRGMIRQHQFQKVEMVSITTAGPIGKDEHERMTGCAETILQRLAAALSRR